MKSTWIRKLLMGVGVFVLLVAAALTYLVATFDANAYTSQGCCVTNSRHQLFWIWPAGSGGGRRLLSGCYY